MKLRKKLAVASHPSCACSKEARIAMATGKGVNKPLRLGPNLSATVVTKITRTAAASIRTGISQNGNFLDASEDLGDGISTRTSAKARRARKNAVVKLALTRYSRNVTDPNVNHPDIKLTGQEKCVEATLNARTNPATATSPRSVERAAPEANAPPAQRRKAERRASHDWHRGEHSSSDCPVFPAGYGDQGN
jgi:hypothetical protein